MKYLVTLIITIGLVFTVWFGIDYRASQKEESVKLQLVEKMAEIERNLGADAVKLIAGMTYTLSGGGISSTATSFTLTSLTLPQNDYEIQDSDLSDTFYITLEPGTRTRQEIISCTTVAQSGSDTTATISGCTRGLSPLTPYTASSTLQFSHAGGTSVIFSDPPQIFNQAAFKDNDEAVTGLWTFNTILPTSSITPTSSAQFTTKTYVDNVALSGAATSSETQAGISELATALEQASSTDLGANRPTVLQAKYATDTPQSGCADGYSATAGAGCTVIARLTGKIRQTWLDLTEAFTWTGTQTFNATTTFSAATSSPVSLRGIKYQWPNTQVASSSVLATDGNGGLSFIASTGLTQYCLASQFGVVQKGNIVGAGLYGNAEISSYSNLNITVASSSPNGSITTMSCTNTVPANAKLVSSANLMYIRNSTGNAYIKFYSASADTDAFPSTASTDQTDTLTTYAGGAADNTIGSITIPAGAFNATAAVDQGDLFTIYIYRDGNDGTDTWNTTFDIVGIQINYN